MAPFNEISNTYFFLQASVRLEGITFDAKVSWWTKQWFGTGKLFVPPVKF